MKIELLGTAGPLGWPESDCRCASCGRLRATGVRLAPTRILLDGMPLEDCSLWDVPGGYDVRAPGGERILVAAGRPEHLGLLRHTGAVGSFTEVHAVHNDHRLSSPAELDRRLSWWARPREGTHRTLLLGGSRSGKSAEAELRLITHADVTYVATSTPPAGDQEWADRIEAHRSRRPRWWRTVETSDLAYVLRTAAGAVLVDGIGGWLAAVMDETGAWDDPTAVRPQIAELVEAWRSTEANVVAVSDEVGLSLVPTTPVGRAFRDTLGTLNQLLASESEEVALIVAGRVLELP